MMLLGGIELRVAGAQRFSLPEVSAQLFLLDVILEQPDFRSIVGLVINQEKLDEWSLRAQIDSVMKLLGHGAKFFEKSDADGFDVAGLVGAARLLMGSGFATKTSDNLIETHGSARR